MIYLSQERAQRAWRPWQMRCMIRMAAILPWSFPQNLKNAISKLILDLERRNQHFPNFRHQKSNFWVVSSFSTTLPYHPVKLLFLHSRNTPANPETYFLIWKTESEKSILKNRFFENFWWYSTHDCYEGWSPNSHRNNGGLKVTTVLHAWGCAP